MARKRPTNRYLAFLRGINVGGHRVKMDHLRELFEQLGLQQVETFIASGNVIFETTATDEPALEQKIEAHLHQALGYAVDTFLRTPADLAGVAAHQPFTAEELAKDGHTLHVVFLRKHLDPAVEQKLLGFRTALDDFQLRGRDLFWLCRGRLTESLVKWPQLTKTIGVSSTARNVKTIHQLVERYPVL